LSYLVPKSRQLRDTSARSASQRGVALDHCRVL
jgi:hypothetical protein